MQGVWQRIVENEMADYTGQNETRIECNEIAVETLVFSFYLLMFKISGQKRLKQ